MMLLYALCNVITAIASHSFFSSLRSHMMFITVTALHT